MKTLWTIVLTSLFSSVVGSLLVWIGIGIFPGSTAGFDFDLYLGILLVSSPVVLIVGGATMMLTLRFLGTSRGALYLTAAGSIGGALTYLWINILLVSLSGLEAVGFLFKSGAVLFPISVGATFGGCFGFALSRFQSLLGNKGKQT